MVFSLNIGGVYAAVGDRTTPYSANTKQRFTFQEYSWDTPKVVELQLRSIITGAVANTIIHNENQFNDVPASDEEWIFMEYDLKYVSGPEEPLQASDVLYTDRNFYTNNGQKISPRDSATLSHAYEGYGQFDVELYPGGESKVYYGILVKKTVGYPLIRIATGYNESTSQPDYSWFSTDPNYHPLVPVSGISLSKANISLKVGEYDSIIPTVSPSDATNNAVTWTSSNESIATVDATGKVTAVGAGTTNITAIAGSYTASCKVNVLVPLSGIALNQTSLSINKGENETLTVTYNPVNTTENKMVIWTSSDKTVATVDSNGKVTAVGAGTANITANVGSFTASCEVNVYVPIKEITLSQTSLNLNIGENETLTVTYNPDNTTDDKTVTWASNDDTVATVDPEGKVMVVGNGTATITATSADGSKTVSCVVWSGSLSAPKIPNTVSSGYNSIKVSWEPVNDSSGYQIYRATSKTGSYSWIKNTDSTSYMDTGLTSGKTYYYKVMAFRYGGNATAYSSYSAEASAKPVPAMPASVKAASYSYNSAKISWKSVSGASGYMIYRSTSKTGTYQIIKTTTSTSYADTGLTTGKTYYYKVRAFRYVGSTKVYSSYTTVVSAKPIPSTPTSFKVTKISSTSAKLSWSKVSGASGYQIYRSTSKTGTYSCINTTTSSYYTNSGLTKGKTYYYKMIAYKMEGTKKVYSKYTIIVPVRL